MNEIYEQAIRKYARLQPRDRHRAAVYAAKATIDDCLTEVRKMTDSAIPDADPAIPMTLFGLPLRIDETAPYGAWRFMVEVE
jgi:hypothetical protein